MEPIENMIHPYPHARGIINDTLRGEPYADHDSERVGPDRGKRSTHWLTCRYAKDAASSLGLHRGPFETYERTGNGALAVSRPEGWINTQLDLAERIEERLGDNDGDEGNAEGDT